MPLIQCELNGPIATITLQRPAKANAYTTEMLQELSSIWTDVESKARIAVISGNSTHFCAGADLSEMKSKTAEDAVQLHSQFVFHQIACSKTLSIAAIDGPALGGGFELALACDLRVASSKAWFALPELRHGLIPAAGGCTRLQNILGSSIAKGVILGNLRISAEQALQWGLVHKMDTDPLRVAISWAQDLAERPQLAQQLAKQVLDDPSLEKERLAQAILYERRAKEPFSG